MITLQVGQTAPDFSLPDQEGVRHQLSDYQGKWVVVYFYPKDDTPGCTTQACGIRDNITRFKQNNTEVFGISVDSVRSHQKFAEKYKLPFTILADDQKDVVKDYGVWEEKKFMGKKYMGVNRTTFIVDPHGDIAAIYEQVKPETHFDFIWRDLSKLQDNWLTAKHS